MTIVTMLTRRLAIVLALATTTFAGTATQKMMQSATLGKPMYYWVYLPANYAEQSKAGKRFSVVYLLHQFSYWAAGWHIGDSWQPNPQTDKAIDSVSGIIAVAPDDGFRGGQSWWLNTPIDTLPDKKEAQLSTFLTQDLKKTIDSSYATLTDRASTGLCGASMGGFGTLHNLRIHPEVYSVGFAVVAGVNLHQWQYSFNISYVLGAYNAAVWNNYDILPNAATYTTKNVKIRFYTTTNDFFRADNISLDSALTKNGVAHQFDTLSGGHEMPTPDRMVMILRYFQSSFPVFTPAPSAVAFRNEKGASPGGPRTTLRFSSRAVADHGVLALIGVDGRARSGAGAAAAGMRVVREKRR